MNKLPGGAQLSGMRLISPVLYPRWVEYKQHKKNRLIGGKYPLKIYGVDRYGEKIKITQIAIWICVLLIKKYSVWLTPSPYEGEGKDD